MIVICIIGISQLFTEYKCIIRIKSIITYCSPLSMTIDLHTSFIRVHSSYKTYHTRVRITVPDSSGIYNNINKMYNYQIKQIVLTTIDSSIKRIRTACTINSCRIKALEDSEIIVMRTVEVIQ